MDKKRPKGLMPFVIIYNALGFVGLEACCYGFKTISQAQSLIIAETDYTQIIAIILTVLFFLSSFLLMEQKKWGYLIPVFLLTFLMAGGFIILLPLFTAHLLFFTHPQVNKQFT